MLVNTKSIAFSLCEVEGSVMPAGDVVKCLGYWWRGDLHLHLLMRKSGKLVVLFSTFGSIGVFQGDVSPLSSRAVLHSCVMLVLLFVCEN